MFLKRLYNSYKNKQVKSNLSSKITGKDLIKKCQQLIQQSQQFSSSNFYTSYFKLMSQKIGQSINSKVQQLQKQFEKVSVVYQKQLASIMLSLIKQQGLLYTIVKLWISFCEFKFNEIIQKFQGQRDETSKEIISFFHKQFCLLCLFLTHICLYLYSKPLKTAQEFEQRNLFIFIRNNITCAPKWSSIHNQIIKNVLPPKANQFSQEDVRLNMQQLDKLCKISAIPVAYMDSRNLMKNFYREHQIESKIKILVKLLNTIRQQIANYRQLNEMDHQQCLISAEDMFSAVAYIIWKTNRNIFGACAYAQNVLCCEYQVVNTQSLAFELEAINSQARHSFQLIKSISQIGLISQELCSSL